MIWDDKERSKNRTDDKMLYALVIVVVTVQFVQYLMALAVVESVRKRPGYEDIRLKIKWPNDIYLEQNDGSVVKIGGILVNSSFIGGEVILIVGVGVNMNNTSPTDCINAAIRFVNTSTHCGCGHKPPSIC